MPSPILPPRLPPPGPERERVLADALLSALQILPQLLSVQTHMEETVLLFIATVEGLRKEVELLRNEVECLRNLVHTAGLQHAERERKNGQVRESDRPVSQHDLDEFRHEMKEDATSPGVIAGAVVAGVAEALDRRERKDPITMTVTLIVQGAKWVSKAKAAWVIGALAGGWCAQSVLRLIHWLK